MAASTVRQPRGLVKVNGTPISGLIGWTWDGNSMFQADQFGVDFAFGALPAANDAGWFSTQTDLDVELFVGFPRDPDKFGAADLESVFSGRTDEVFVKWEQGMVSLKGRDLTAPFLDNKNSAKWPMKTSSEIVTALAGKYGLTPVVTATSTRVGKYYKDAYVRLQDDRTEWDLLTWLAREEGFVVYVQGKELHFGPAPTASTYTLTYTPPAKGELPSGQMVRTDTSRVLTVARDIKVIVRSWNPKKKVPIIRDATRNKKGSAQVQTYVYTFPNLDAAGCQARANQILADLSRHEMQLRFSGPADSLLKKSDLIAFKGTGTAFDQTYYPDSIARTFSAREGYSWRVSAKNHSPESQVSL